MFLNHFHILVSKLFVGVGVSTDNIGVDISINTDNPFNNNPFD